MAGILTLTFINANAVVDESIDLTGGGKTLTFKLVRTGEGKVTIQDTIVTQIDSFKNAFDLDYNRTTEYILSTTGTTLAIEHEDNTHFDSFVDGTHNLTTNITTVKSTTTQQLAVTLDVVYSANTVDFCDTCKAGIFFNQNVDGILVEQLNFDGSIRIEILNNPTFNSDNATVVISRDLFILFITYTLNGVDTLVTKTSPKHLTINEIEVEETAFGGRIKIETQNFIGDEESTYAIGTISGGVSDYQSSPEFFSIAPGLYQGYALDKYGCTRSKQFSISETATTLYRVPLKAFISNKMPVRIVRRDLPAGVLTASQVNMFHFEAPYPVSDKTFVHKYGVSQKPDFQFKSAYPKHTVVYAPCLVEDFESLTVDTPIEITQKTDNIQQNTFLDAQYTFNATTSRRAIYFIPGNTYNENLVVNGTHTYNHELPAFYEVGMILRLGGQGMEITDIVVEGGIEYAITSNRETGTGTGIVESIHIALEYEVFCFTLDFGSMPPYDFYVKVSFLKDNDTVDQYWSSQMIRKVEDIEITDGNFHVLEYWSESSDAEIDYSLQTSFTSLVAPTAYRGLKNIEFITPLKRIANADIDTEKLDHRVLKLDFKTIRVYETDLKAVPAEEAGAIMDILDQSEYLKIDNILYTTIGGATITHVGQYAVVKAQLALSQGGNEYNIQTKIPDLATSGFYPVKSD